ncbi:MAG TPA: dockerin type I repeat-containing protein [Patescibacteria group bacterium]|nr:dockerin type I repeat-containing protein [Patescibacteria group bacterium]
MLYKKAILIFLFLAISSVPVKAAAPQVTGPVTVSPSSASVKKYQKIEFSFNLSKTYPNPYYFYDPSDTQAANPSRMTWFGVDGVTVNINITTPSGKQLVLPAFFYQDYTRHIVGSRNVMGKSGLPVWKGRFTWSEVGTYSYTVSAEDKEGKTQTSAQTFSITADNSNPGFIKPNPQDPRYMVFDNGSSYVPLSRGYPWGDNYESRFVQDKQYGINLIRIWDQNDFSLGVEGAHTTWINASTTDGAAVGVTINTNTHSGMRAAQPGTAWYQRLAVTEPNRSHKLKVWTKGTVTVSLRSLNGVLPGSVISGTQIDANSTSYTLSERTYTPSSDLVVYFQGSGYVDDVEFGPVDAQGNILYSIVTDGDMERHFAKDNVNNDPNSNTTLPRPLGNYFNPEECWLQDQYIDAGVTNSVYIQLCSCSGPWFTWPGNPESPDSWDWSQPWVLKSWQRNFRYRVARWGYATSILAWENHNELGHVLPNTSIFNFFQQYADYQKQTDIYQHMRTTSQGSQAFSPAFWSSPAFNLTNYHDYMMISRYSSALTNDEVNFVHRFAWCLYGRQYGKYYCDGLGIGDSTDWTPGSAPRPFVWGEIGVGTTEWNQPNPQGTTGEGAHRAHHNGAWTGLFSPMATTPIFWYDNQNDSSYSNLVNQEKLVMKNFFQNISFSTSNFTSVMTAADTPSGYTGTTLSVQNDTGGKTRAFALVSGDRYRAYLWVQHRDYIWSNTGTPGTINPTVSIPNLQAGTYNIEYWNTYTGAVTTSVISSGGTLSIPVSGLNKDIAIKAVHTGSPVPTSTPIPTAFPTGISTPIPTIIPTATPTATSKPGDANGDGKVNGADYLIWFNNYKKSTSQGPSAGDFNGDTIVNGADYIIWFGNYGK